MLTDELKEEAVGILRGVLNEQQEWVKVHAAEFLIWTGHSAGVKEIYKKEEENFSGKTPYRIGIWRVLYQLSEGKEQQVYKQHILNAFLDTAGKDRIHAVETLGKLRIPPYTVDPAISEAALNSNIVALKGYTHWAVAYTSDNAMNSARQYYSGNINNPDVGIVLQQISAYVLRYIGGVSVEQWNRMADGVLALPDGTDGKIIFLTTLVITADEAVTRTEKYRSVRGALLSYKDERAKGARIEIANATAEKGGEADIPLLKKWMNNEDPIGVVADDADVQASAAYAILQINKRLGAPDNIKPGK
ncbi:MAG: hypothetical protein KIT80_07810 [Chitinophagaceae bacterium]|nr:hypothetical protein [Chitinophagaceae bacterium]MCW5926799.1 hypothetical protein [Chitinophagaceae bacterium]